MEDYVRRWQTRTRPLELDLCFNLVAKVTTAKLKKNPTNVICWQGFLINHLNPYDSRKTAVF